MLAFLTSIGYESWVLPTLLALPVAAALVILLHGASGRGEGSGGLDDARAMFPRRITLFTFVLQFILSLGLWWVVAPGETGWRAVVDVPWIRTWGINFAVGVDGISAVLVLLTTFLMPLVVLGGWTSVRAKLHSYHALMLILTTGMLGAFVARDLFLFYVMWEVMLVPMYFIIGIWGGTRRLYAALKFFIFTFVGSLLMLVAILYLGIKAGDPATGIPNFAFDAIFAAAARTGQGGLTIPGLDLFVPGSVLLFLAFFSAFAVKVPMFPFHTWLPDAHVEAPTAGSVILASIMLKLGTYGFIRLAIPLFPTAAMSPGVRTTMIVLAVVGVIYGSLVAMVQPDFKKLVAYSSVAHLGMVMLGLFALTRESVQGAMMVMIGHGLSTGALFLLIGMIYERRHSRELAAYGGIAKVVPVFATLLTIVALSSIGLPGTNGFVSEFLVMVGSFKTYPVLTTISALGVILAAAYLLWALQRIIYNPLDKAENEHLTDLNWREIGLLTPVIAAIFWLGIYPKPILTRMEGATTAFVRTVESGASQQTASLPSGGR
ncbi:MAG TPA: NADH-quinone oxidoreductase subunit M [Gemmatimonadaceae bacterium]|jgi:NADH-quinone oxidoreductase subunit M|nr:NADH-quinone oxidoreductase subunit M [Gemmatimonadaceae bacterium]